MNKKKSNELATALQGFFRDYLPRQKGTSLHTAHSYRDSMKLLLVFLARNNGPPVNSLCFEDMNVSKIIAFLDHLESERHNSVGTRNIRLSAVHSFFRYVASMFPEYLDLSQQILSVPFKRKRQINRIFFITGTYVMMGQPETIKEDAHDRADQSEPASLPPATLAGTCKSLETEWPGPGRVLQAA